MKQLKIYLDTSVISYLDQQERLEKMNDSLLLWDKIKEGAYRVVISDVTLDEIYKCPEPKLSILKNYLAEINFDFVTATAEVYNLAKYFINNNILTQKSIDDCRHIACAMLYDCDIIVSWNFKHIVNHKTINGVKLISAITGYDDVAIYSPTILTGGECYE